MADELFGDRLLLLDDERAFGQTVKRIVEACGIEAVVTDDPAIFINAARLWHPSVIMLDLKMPGVDGIQLLRSLAADKSAAHVIITSGADEKVREAAMQLGRERGLNMAGVLRSPSRHASSINWCVFASSPRTARPSVRRMVNGRVYTVGSSNVAS